MSWLRSLIRPHATRLITSDARESVPILVSTSNETHALVVA
jgi:hypothetical protein